MKKLPIHPRQILTIALIIVAVFLLLDYQARINQLYKVESQYEILHEEVIMLRQTAQALQEENDFANSPAMVEQFAREELSAGQPGDVRIVPLPSNDLEPTPIPVAQPSAQSVTNWQVWKALFFE